MPARYIAADTLLNKDMDSIAGQFTACLPLPILKDHSRSTVRKHHCRRVDVG